MFTDMRQGTAEDWRQIGAAEDGGVGDLSTAHPE